MATNEEVKKRLELLAEIKAKSEGREFNPMPVRAAEEPQEKPSAWEKLTTPQAYDPSASAGKKIGTAIKNVPGSALRFAEGAVKSQLDPRSYSPVEGEVDAEGKGPTFGQSFNQLASERGGKFGAALDVLGEFANPQTYLKTAGMLVPQAIKSLGKGAIKSAKEGTMEGIDTGLQEAERSLVEDSFGQAAIPVLTSVGIKHGKTAAAQNKQMAAAPNLLEPRPTNLKPTPAKATPMEAVVSKTIKAPGEMIKTLAEFGISQLSGLSPKTLKVAYEGAGEVMKAKARGLDRATVSDEVQTIIDTKLEELQYTGKEYEAIRKDNSKVLVMPKNIVRDTLAKHNIRMDSKGKITVNAETAPLSPGDISAIEHWYKQYGKSEAMSNNAYLNARRGLDNLAAWDASKTEFSDVVARDIRKAMDSVAKLQNPKLKDVDAKYAPMVQEFKQIKRELLDKDGTLKDNATNKIANAANPGREKFLARLEQIKPGITKDIDLVKALEDIEAAKGQKVGAYARQGMTTAGAITAASGNVPAALGMGAVSLATHPTNAVRMAETAGRIGKGVNAVKSAAGNAVDAAFSTPMRVRGLNMEDVGLGRKGYAGDGGVDINGGIGQDKGLSNKPRTPMEADTSALPPKDRSQAASDAAALYALGDNPGANLNSRINSIEPGEIRRDALDSVLREYGTNATASEVITLMKSGRNLRQSVFDAVFDGSDSKTALNLANAISEDYVRSADAQLGAVNGASMSERASTAAAVDSLTPTKSKPVGKRLTASEEKSVRTDISNLSDRFIVNELKEKFGYTKADIKALKTSDDIENALFDEYMANPELAKKANVTFTSDSLEALSKTSTSPKDTTPEAEMRAAGVLPESETNFDKQLGYSAKDTTADAELRGVGIGKGLSDSDAELRSALTPTKAKPPKADPYEKATRKRIDDELFVDFTEEERAGRKGENYRKKRESEMNAILQIRGKLLSENKPQDFTFTKGITEKQKGKLQKEYEVVTGLHAPSRSGKAKDMHIALDYEENFLSHYEARNMRNPKEYTFRPEKPLVSKNGQETIRHLWQGEKMPELIEEFYDNRASFNNDFFIRNSGRIDGLIADKARAKGYDSIIDVAEQEVQLLEPSLAKLPGEPVKSTPLTSAKPPSSPKAPPPTKPRNGGTPVEAKPAAKPFEGTKSYTTKVLDSLKGKTSVSKQFIQDQLKREGVKQAEKDLITKALAGEGDKIDVARFAEKVEDAVLPLKRKTVGKDYWARDRDGKPQSSRGSRYGRVALPDESRGEVASYTEHVYESPVKTSAGSGHWNHTADNYRSNKIEKTNYNGYFAHTRVEDMADGRTRRVIEAQSDLMQKGRLDSEEFLDAADNEVELAKNPNWLDSAPTKNEVMRKQEDYRKLKPYENTWHERIVREEVKQAAADGKSVLQFPTGETAMKIQGLGQGGGDWFATSNLEGFRHGEALTPEKLKVGETVVSPQGDDQWVITEVMDGGKFKAVPKKDYDAVYKDTEGKRISAEEFDNRGVNQESFDISGSVDKQNPIYKFYESEIGAFLRKKYQAVKVTDPQGVSWWELKVDPAKAKTPIEAFGVIPIVGSALTPMGAKKEEE